MRQKYSVTDPEGFCWVFSETLPSVRGNSDKGHNDRELMSLNPLPKLDT